MYKLHSLLEKEMVIEAGNEHTCWFGIEEEMIIEETNEHKCIYAWE